jgi:hypothetical protein
MKRISIILIHRKTHLQVCEARLENSEIGYDKLIIEDLFKKKKRWKRRCSWEIYSLLISQITLTHCIKNLNGKMQYQDKF